MHTLHLILHSDIDIIKESPSVSTPTLSLSHAVACSLETCRNEALENIASQDQRTEIQSYAEKLTVIKEVLARRHMKVAFFGR